MAFSVLIVDDSPAMRSFVRRVIEMSGLDMGVCLEGENGRAALEVLKHHWVDVILTDINMPEMNGEEFVQHIAADPTLKGTPVIVISTDKTDDRVEQMMALGAKSYIKKPFAPEMLRSEIERVLEEAYVSGN